MQKIFVNGVHGVGKTTILKKSGLSYYTVSELIQKANSNYDPQSKQVSDVHANQVLWQKELEKINDENFIIDGHFVLLNSQNKLETIKDSDLDVGISKIVMIYGDVNQIFHNLKIRGKKTFKISLIKKMQDQELFQASVFADQHQIPFALIHTGDISSFKREVHNELSSKTHLLKIDSDYFDDILTKGKNFEIRLNDRNYQIADILVLRAIKKDGKFDGRVIVKEIGYISDYAQKNGYVVLGFNDKLNDNCQKNESFL